MAQIVYPTSGVASWRRILKLVYFRHRDTTSAWFHDFHLKLGNALLLRDVTLLDVVVSSVSLLHAQRNMDYVHEGHEVMNEMEDNDGWCNLSQVDFSGLNLRYFVTKTQCEDSLEETVKLLRWLTGAMFGVPPASVLRAAQDTIAVQAFEVCPR